ncbi:MAG: hypothetical protein AB1896_07825 [Thermodesulfobacteriota bacterium]
MTGADLNRPPEAEAAAGKEEAEFQRRLDRRFARHAQDDLMLILRELSRRVMLEWIRRRNEK